MSGDSNSREATFEEVNSRLSEGLKTCRSVVSTYRTLLSDPALTGNDNEPSGDLVEFPDNDP